LASLVLYAIWPKYGLCGGNTRYDEIVCVARRNLHFSAHFTWSFNTETVAAVQAELRPGDVPVLAAMLGDERAVLRGLAGYLLSKSGEEGLARLEHAAQSDDPVVRHSARTALMDHLIISSDPKR
jgi:hypothetical protein